MGSFQLPEDASHLEISGNYPEARYMSFNAYDKWTQPTDALIDRDIIAFDGANPYSSADKSGGKYRIKVISEAAPTSDRPENTLYLGDSATRNDVLHLIMRVCIPENGTDFTGNAGISDVSMVMKNGETLSGEASGEYDMRYWSLCTNENIATTRYADCVYDSNVVVDEERQYTVVISKAANRPANAAADCGVTWLDWSEHGDGAGNTEQGKLIIRNMEEDDFQFSTQNVKSMGSAEQDMGPYFPETHYTRKAEFEALGCN